MVYKLVVADHPYTIWLYVEVSVSSWGYPHPVIIPFWDCPWTQPSSCPKGYSHWWKPPCIHPSTLRLWSMRGAGRLKRTGRFHPGWKACGVMAENGKIIQKFYRSILMCFFFCGNVESLRNKMSLNDLHINLSLLGKWMNIIYKYRRWVVLTRLKLYICTVMGHPVGQSSISMRIEQGYNMGRNQWSTMAIWESLPPPWIQVVCRLSDLCSLNFWAARLYTCVIMCYKAPKRNETQIILHESETYAEPKCSTACQIE